MTKPFLNQGQIDVMNQIIGYGEAHGFTLQQQSYAVEAGYLETVLSC